MTTKPTVNVHDDRVEIDCKDWELTPVVIGPPLEFCVTDEKGQSHFFHGERAAKFLRNLQEIEGIDLAEMLRMQVGGVNVTFAAPQAGTAPQAGEVVELNWDGEETALYDANIAFLDPEKIGVLRVCLSENEISYLNDGMRSKEYNGIYDRGVDCLVDLNRVADSLDEDDALKWAEFLEGLAAKLRAGPSDDWSIRPVRFTPKAGQET